MLEQKTITRILHLPEDASDRDVLDRLSALLEAAGEDAGDLSDRELLHRGEHERVTMTATGATVTLYCPFKSGTEQVEELPLRRPTAKDLRRMEDAKGGALARGLSMLAALSGRAPAEIDLMDAADANLCMTVIGFLQRPPRRTGSSSSAS